MEEIHIPKEIYPKIALIKAAYHFTDTAYVFIRDESDSFVVEIELKELRGENNNLVGNFKNELLAQTAR